MQQIMSQIRAAVDSYQLIQAGDRIAVGISGGKDSLVLLCTLANMRKFLPMKYDLVAITVDPCFDNIQTDFRQVEELCRRLQIKYEIRRSQLGNIIFEQRKESNPCSLCARMRRGILHDMSKKHNCNKLALGHHFDDVIETILMGMFYGGKVETMMPKLHSQNFEGMELIRPMYLIKEDDIIAWRDYNQLNFIQCACRFTENCVSCGGGRGSKRDEMKELIKEFRKQGDIIEKNIFRSVHNVNLRTIIGYHKDDMEYNFLDDYNERGK